MSDVIYAQAATQSELEQILQLQQINVSESISENELKDQGFVTVKHDLSLLQAMKDACPHIVAKSENKVVGYALVMLRDFRDRIPVLIPMFDQIDGIVVNGKPLRAGSYFVMGQVCIAKEFRSRGLFQGMYEYMQICMSKNFEWVITEVSKRNPRSLRAHEKVGFECLKVYEAEGEIWEIIGWKW